MKNDYIRMFICVVITSIILTLILKIDNRKAEYRTTTKKYTVYEKNTVDKEKNSYCIKCIDSNDDMFTLHIESVPNVTNVNANSFYEHIEEGRQYDFTTIYYRRAYSTFPKLYIIGMADANIKNTKGD